MKTRTGKAALVEWVALMAVLAERDREKYRELRKEAWDSAQLLDRSRLAN